MPTLKNPFEELGPTLLHAVAQPSIITPASALDAARETLLLRQFQLLMARKALGHCWSGSLPQWRAMVKRKVDNAERAFLAALDAAWAAQERAAQ